MSLQKHKLITFLQSGLIIISGAALGWVLGLVSGYALLCTVLGTVLGVCVALKSKSRARMILAAILTVPLTLVVAVCLVVGAVKFNNYLKLQKTRTYYVQEADISFELGPGWQAKAHPEAAVLPYFFDLGGGYKDSQDKTITLVELLPPTSKDAPQDNGGIIEIRQGDTVSSQSSEFEKVYGTKGSEFTADGITGTKLAGYDTTDRVSITEYLFYVPRGSKTVRFYYARKPSTKALEPDFERLVKSTDL